ncbi:MAG: ADP-ribosylglycohydrolase family protein [Candidatus Thorarchaeota archaeon]
MNRVEYTMVTQQERYEGCMLGLAIGDAIGAATEFLTYDEIRRRFPPNGVDHFQSFRGMRPGSYTDDTEMSIAVAKGLLNAKDFTTVSIMESMTREFIDWMDNTSSTRSPGNTCLRGVGNLKSGVPYTESGVLGSKGCGTAMRSAPIGLAYCHALDAITSISKRVSLMTHDHPTATAGSFATAFLVAKSLDGSSSVSLLDELVRQTKPIDNDFTNHMKRIPEALNLEKPEAAHELLGRGWVAEEAVAGALYVNIKHPDSFRQIILEAANSGGDTDTKACIAGAIAGTRLGRDSIPAGWIEGIENRELLISLGKQLIRLQSKLEEI